MIFMRPDATTSSTSRIRIMRALSRPLVPLWDMFLVFQGTEVCMITFETSFDETIYICFYYTYKEYMRMDRAQGE